MQGILFKARQLYVQLVAATEQRKPIKFPVETVTVLVPLFEFQEDSIRGRLLFLDQDLFEWMGVF